MTDRLDDDEDEKQQICSLCREASPITQTNFTLISNKHQWRMELVCGADGHKEPRWYCPECWQKLKQIRVGSAPARPSLGNLPAQQRPSRPPSGGGGSGSNRVK